ncbi:hypothetical protein Bca101_070627 [Brassica carinata]
MDQAADDQVGLDQAADDQVGLDQAAEFLPRDQPRRTIPLTETADNTSPWIRTRELEVRVVDRGRRLQVDSVRGLRPERSNMQWVNRGPRPRVKPVCDQFRDHFSIWFSGSNPGLSDRPGSSFKLL